MYYLAVKDKKGKWTHVKVQEEVYIYVKQLEGLVKYPEISKLKYAYPERFNP